jgi:hypothetical protein
MSFTVPLTLLSLLGWVGTLAAPMYLRTHTTWVIAAAPRPSFVALGGHRVSFWLLLAIMVGRAMCAKPFHYMMGRRWGPKLSRGVARRWRTGARMMAWLERAIDRWGVWAVLLRADGRVMNLVGARSLNPVAVGAAALVNAVVHSLLWLTLGPRLLEAGEAAGALGEHVGLALAAWFASPVGALVSAPVVLAALVHLLLRWQRRPVVVAPVPVA